MANILSNLVNKGELPTVQVEVGLSRETIIDAAAAAVMTAIVVVLLNKFLLQKL